MKKLFVILLAALSFNAVHAQVKFKVTPKAVLAGDTIKAVQIAAITNDFDSVTTMQALLFVYSSGSNQPETLRRRFVYPKGTFTHTPALKSELITKLETELDIEIIQ